MLDQTSSAFFVGAWNECRVGRPVTARRSPHRLRFRAHNLEGSVAFELLPVAGIDQAPIVPRLGDQCLKFAHVRRLGGDRELGAHGSDGSRAREHRRSHIAHLVDRHPIEPLDDLMRLAERTIAEQPAR